MTDKEQIIINGVTYYKQQDINESLDEEHYITEFHLLATHYNLLLEDYARKEQEYSQLKEDYEELEKRHNEAFQDFERLKQECKELKKENQQLRNSLSDILMFKFTGQENETNCYRKALEEIEEVWGKEETGDYDFVRWQILNIINKAKGEGDER